MALSKSRYTNFCQCDKMLWLQVHKPQEAQEDEGAQSSFETGRLVGKYAQQLFHPFVDATQLKPNGAQDRDAMLLRTRELLKAGTQNIAEAAFSWNGNYCAVDILHRTDKGYAIYEVKSTSSDSDDGNSPKELLPYLQDVAYQKYVLSQCGITVTGTYLVQLNRAYVRGPQLDIQQLFVVSDLAPFLDEESAKVPNNIAVAQNLLQQTAEPGTEMGRQCNNPNDCPFRNYCTKSLLHQVGSQVDFEHDITVLNFYRMPLKKKLELLKQGIVTMDQVDDIEDLTKIQQLQVNNYISKADYIDVVNIRKFLNEQIRYPLYFLDFETSQYAIPQFEGSKPYQQIPFQYSLHYIEREGGALKHKEFLGDGKNDPRRALAEQLVADIPMGVCTTAYNKAFECGRIKELADLFTDLSEHLLDIRNHIVDFLDPFREGDFYKEQMMGSFSIKKVLPALFPNDPSLDYHNLQGTVHNGADAMTVYPLLADMPLAQQQATRESLLRYCELDTYAMVKLWEKLVEVSQS